MMKTKILFIFFNYFIASGVVGVSWGNCVKPPLECPNKNITFWLFTRSNKDNPFELDVGNNDTITSAPWVQDAPVKIIIHGYTGHKYFSPNVEIRPAYLECCDYNIISVDYNKIALEPCYLEAAHNTELVGMCTAQLIDELVIKHNFQLPQFHVIGFSLGGQITGYVGDYLQSGRLERITALDPALPLFATTDNKKKVDSSDAKFVDILHTNALEKGKLEASGHLDFFANGGINQPGCTSTKTQTKSGCNHARAPQYYAESITSTTGFYGTKCYSWIYYMMGWCELFYSDEEVIFGEHAPHNATGVYFFNTNSEPPYARGSQRKTRSISQKLLNFFKSFYYY